MRLQTKISLAVLPLIALAISILGTLSVMTATSGIRHAMYQIIEQELEDYFDHVVVDLHGVLEKHGLSHVDSFVAEYQRQALEAATKIHYFETGHLIFFGPGDKVLFCSRGHDEAIGASWRSAVKEVGLKKNGYTRGQIRTETGGEIYIGRHFAPWKWTIFYAISIDELLAPGRKIRNATLTAAVLCTMVGFLLIFLVLKKFVILPVAKLKDAAGAVAARESIDAISVHSRDELGSLARSMEDMARSIQTYQAQQADWQRQLKEKIAQRTAILKENERFLATILESIQDGICVLDRDLTIVQTNVSMRTHYSQNRSPEGKKCYEIFRKRREPCPSCPTVRAFASGKLEMEEMTIKNNGTITKTVEVHAFPILDESGAPSGVVEYVRDISQRKAMEQVVAEALDLNETIIGSASMGIAAYEATGQCVLANEAVANIIGATREQYLSQNFNNIPSWKRSGLLDETLAVLEEGRTRHKDLHVVSTFGREIWLDCHLIRFYRSGTPHLLLIIEDVTERKAMAAQIEKRNLALEKANLELEKANRQIVEQQKAVIEEERLKVLLQMAGATAHELNQPLMALLGNIELMELNREHPERLARHITVIEDAGRRISEIVKKIQTIRHDQTIPYADNTTIINLDQAVHILAVEDSDKDHERIAEAMGGSAGIHLHRAGDIAEGLQKLSEETFDLVFLDYLLPSGTGMEFMAEMARAGQDIPVIVITGQGDEMVAAKVLQAGAYDYLPKTNISSVALNRVVTNAMEKHRLKREVSLTMEKMAEMSTRDALTGLFNRGYFNEAIEGEAARAERYETGFTLLMADLDHFKRVNDSQGHLAGDRVLVEVADRLRTCLRKCDIPCRYGGEEFAVILPGTPLEESMAIGERFRNLLEASPIDYDGVPVAMTVSVGAAAFLPGGSQTAETLVQAADRSLYRAKANGRNCVRGPADVE
ncbi:MAG: diguanylate cyclase [Desulfobacterales bacterium]|nr:diguanylate cyclase [Desulfobacterales bacterium]